VTELHTSDGKQPLVTAERIVSEVLFYVWDPIGVSSILFARGEYESYVAEVVAMLRAGTSVGGLSEALVRIEVEHMGLDGSNPHSARKAAEMLVRWDFGRTPVAPDRRTPSY